MKRNSHSTAEEELKSWLCFGAATDAEAAQRNGARRQDSHLYGSCRRRPGVFVELPVAG